MKSVFTDVISIIRWPISIVPYCWRQNVAQLIVYQKIVYVDEESQFPLRLLSFDKFSASDLDGNLCTFLAIFIVLAFFTCTKIYYKSIKTQTFFTRLSSSDFALLFLLIQFYALASTCYCFCLAKLFTLTLSSFSSAYKYTDIVSRVSSYRCFEIKVKINLFMWWKLN